MHEYRVIEWNHDDEPFKEICDVTFEDGKPVSWTVATVTCPLNNKLEDVLGRMKEALWKPPIGIEEFD